MSKDYRKDIENLLFDIKVKTGLKDKDIAKRLNYNPSYFSRIISEGGNETMYKKLKILSEDGINNSATDKQNKQHKIERPDQFEQALLKTLLTDYIKLKSQLTKRSVEDIAEELDQNTKLTLRELKKS